MLLVVAKSSGSSPGRQGFKMAIGTDGELIGSIGGGVMEVNLVEQSRQILSGPPASAGVTERDEYKIGRPANEYPRTAIDIATTFLREQNHRANSKTPSGMICSGSQTVIFKMLYPGDLETVQNAIGCRDGSILQVTAHQFKARPPKAEISAIRPQSAKFRFEQTGDNDFLFEENLGRKNNLCIIGGGHCALALSELMSKLDFHISLFDDRSDLNTLDKNRFLNEKIIVENYELIGELIHSGSDKFVVVMTLGYKSDSIVIKMLLDKSFKYFGVLGSKAKMAALFKQLRAEGFPAEKLDKIHTPIGLPINSRTPEEIAVSIAAEIISIKNS